MAGISYAMLNVFAPPYSQGIDENKAVLDEMEDMLGEILSSGEITLQ